MISYHTCPLAFEEGKETGGMNVYVYELSKYLAKLGHKVDVITRCQDEKEKKIVQVSEGFRVIHLSAGPARHVDKKNLLEYIPEFVASFSGFVKSQMVSYDILHAHYYQSGLIGIELKKQHLQNVPFIVTYHTLALMKNLVARTEAEMESTDRIRAEQLISKSVNMIIAPSESDKKYLHFLYDVPEDRVVKIPPGVNIDLFKPIPKLDAKVRIGAKNEEKIILFVGRIEPLKGVDALLYALKIICRNELKIPFKLYIVGGDISQQSDKWPSQLKHLDKVRRILGVEECVRFIGQKPQHELPYYYNAAEIVVMPSHYESFGMAAAEAMACGTPVITTNVTGISGLIDERRSNLITSVNNPLLLATQISKLLTDKEMYDQIRKNIMENVEDLSWEKVVKQIEEVYETLSLRAESVS